MSNNNATNTALCIHGVFENQVRIRPNDVAIRFLGCEISYSQLNARANYLASHLQSFGVKSGDVVGLSIAHSPELVIAMLAILKCGAAYLPFDSTNPDARKRLYLDMANVDVVILDGNESPGFTNDRTIVHTNNTKLFTSYLSDFNTCYSTDNDKAYIMFTSGSTGEPKGVVVPHRSVIRLVIDTNYIQIGITDNVLQLAPPSFDASTFELWGALLNGAVLTPYSGTVIDPNLLKREILDNGITILWLTAALFHLLASHIVDALTSIRILLAGGDVLNPKYVNLILNNLPGVTVINGYGPTENTTFTCCHVMTSANPPSAIVPIGKPITGTSIHILDKSLRPVKRGEIGELFVSGKGVALGYLGNTSQLTDFFTNTEIAEGLIYRTGDMVRVNSNGEINFVGRKDNQVKIRGYRVSLEEVRSCIVEIEHVQDALVLKKEIESGDQLMVAYVQLAPQTERTSLEIKNQISTFLPDYMIPDKFVFVAHLPVTENGKVDLNTISAMKM